MKDQRLKDFISLQIKAPELKFKTVESEFKRMRKNEYNKRQLAEHKNYK